MENHVKQIEAMKQKQYLPKTAKIRFIVYWRKENTEQEIGLPSTIIK
jgi:ATP-dependent DNA helicase RecQ